MTEFRKIYEEYAGAVYRFLLSLTGSEDMAEELLSETFYQALRHIDSFEGRCSIYTWLCQIAKNAYLKECKRKRRYIRLEPDAFRNKAADSSMEERAEDREMYLEAVKAVSRLTEPYREVFILHALGGVRLKEIAEMHGRSESWARVTYFRARQMIAKEITE
ncbi:MAG: sigma-70 family RNA polymerase sigma factor [Clostridia bacterium]|nr:sigma-70 family RNA polymerase sigma factor [Clostridia bacterium]